MTPHVGRAALAGAVAAVAWLAPGLAHAGDAQVHTDADYVWVLICAALVLFMQAGFLLLESGLAQAKNSINVAIKNTADFVIATAGFWTVGFALMFGTGNMFFGTEGFAPDLDDPWTATFFVFQLAFCGTSATIVSGAIAERASFHGYLAISLFVSVLIYPILGHWIWGSSLHGAEAQGWLQSLGFHDFAGSTAVHVAGAGVSLAAITRVGPRRGRFNEKGETQRRHPSNLTSVFLGVFILFFGWFGFNGGSTLAAGGAAGPIIIKTILSACFGGLAGGAVGTFTNTNRKFGAEAFVVGILGGLVAITAGCDVVSTAAAVPIGIVGGTVAALGGKLLERMKLDDAVDAIPVHGMAGGLGTILVGVFAPLDEGQTRLGFIGTQALGVGVAIIWAVGVTHVFLRILAKFVALRVSERDELVGLNVAEHDAGSGLLDLAQSMMLARAAGRYTEDLKVVPEQGTEIGDLAVCFNEMLDAVRVEQDRTRDAKARVELILDNTDDAFFVVDDSGVLRGEPSAAAQTWFGPGNGRLVWDYLFADEPGRRAFYEIGFSQVTDGLLPLDVALDQLPSSFRRDAKHFEIRVRPVRADDGEPRLLYVVKDVTAEIEARHANEQAAELQRLVTEVMRSPAAFEHMVTSSESTLAGLATLSGDLLKLRLHTLKGDAAVVGFQTFSRVCHRIEDEIEEDAQTRLTAAQHELLTTAWTTSLDRVRPFLPNSDRSGSLSIARTDYDGLLDRLASRMDHAQLEVFAHSWLHLPLEMVFEGLARGGQRTAERLGRHVDVAIDGAGVRIHPQHVSKVRGLMLHLIRNAVDHGYQPPEQRIRQGKPEHGQLVLRAAIDADALILSVTDDGAGIDWDRVRSRALARGLPATTPQDLLDALCSSELSTSDTVTEVSGRGVGMAAVLEQVRSLGGRLEVVSKPGVGTSFIMHIPRRFDDEEPANRAA